mmetsp:Transcript_19505/g.49964  ORF Transcript_19505/g.49964 Transcript_19505/m.49964 type:complete len:177 (-) Transcript_19505:1473-2003(-)
MGCGSSTAAQAVPEQEPSKEAYETKKVPEEKENAKEIEHHSVEVPNSAKEAGTAPGDGNGDKGEKEMNEEDAAVAIQSAMRGHQARKEVAELKKQKEGETEVVEESKAEGEPTGGEEKSAEAVGEGDGKKEMNEEDAAVAIQSAMRGHQARKEVAELKQQRTGETVEENNSSTGDS